MTDNIPAVPDNRSRPPAMLGAYIPRQLAEAERVAGMLANSGACGRMQPGEVFAVMMAGARYNLDPITATRTFFVADGRVGIYSAGMHGLILASGLCDELTLVADPSRNGLEYAEWRCKYRGRPAQNIRFSQEDAKRAGLWGKKSRKGYDTPWTQYPDRMLTARALSKAARLVWPDVVSGLYTFDEIKSGDFDADVIQAEFIDDHPQERRPAPAHRQPAPTPAPEPEPPREADTGSSLPPYGVRSPMRGEAFAAACVSVDVKPGALADWYIEAGGGGDLRGKGNDDAFRRAGVAAMLRWSDLREAVQRGIPASDLADALDLPEGDTAWARIKAEAGRRLGGES